jgi:hypothetical protein
MNEDTGLTELGRIATLYRIVAILSAISFREGMLIDEVIPIKNKSHGRKSVSYIKFFLDFLHACKTKLVPAFKTIIYRLKSLLNLPSFIFCRVP